MFYTGHLPHAIILNGDSDQQLENACKFLACIILCQNKELKLHPCKNCKSCRKVISNIHPDLTYVEGKKTSKSIHVDDIRQVISESYIIPTESNNKVFIIQGAENMTIQAQNAILKLLEEPPKGVFFILSCKNLDSILKTVQSRAQVFYLNSKAEDYEQKQQREAFNYANILIEDLVKNDQYDFLIQTSTLHGNKELFKNVLEEIHTILGQAIRFNYLRDKDINCIALIEKLLQKFNISVLVDKQNIISEIYNRMEHNANQNLNITWLCAGLF